MSYEYKDEELKNWGIFIKALVSLLVVIVVSIATYNVVDRVEQGHNVVVNSNVNTLVPAK